MEHFYISYETITCISFDRCKKIKILFLFYIKIIYLNGILSVLRNIKLPLCHLAVNLEAGTVQNSGSIRKNSAMVSRCWSPYFLLVEKLSSY